MVALPVKMVIAMRTDLNMRRGKQMAQAGHAAEAFLYANNLSKKAGVLRCELTDKAQAWITRYKRTKIVVGVDSLGELEDLVFKAKFHGIEHHVITDAGATEFNGVPTVTCVALGPEYVDVINPLTGHLKLL